MTDFGYSLWDDASRDVEADNRLRARTAAGIDVEPLWVFLSLAQSKDELGHRLALVDDRIEAVASQYGIDQADLVEEFERRHATLMQVRSGGFPFPKSDNMQDGDSDDSDNDGESDGGDGDNDGDEPNGQDSDSDGDGDRDDDDDSDDDADESADDDADNDGVDDEQDSDAGQGSNDNGEQDDSAGNHDNGDDSGNPFAKNSKTAGGVPRDFPVQPLADGENPSGKATCGDCGRSWDDNQSTSWTPTPSGRCPFEYFHEGASRRTDRTAKTAADEDEENCAHEHMSALDANRDQCKNCGMVQTTGREASKTAGDGTYGTHPISAPSKDATCDIHEYVHKTPGVPAAYDGKTVHGPWAYMCEDCFPEHGIGLGVGRGQRLVKGSSKMAINDAEMSQASNERWNQTRGMPGYYDDDEDVSDDDSTPGGHEGQCPSCGGPSTYLGQLGHTHHYRCRNCGMDHSTSPGQSYTSVLDNYIASLGSRLPFDSAPKTSPSAPTAAGTAPTPTPAPTAETTKPSTGTTEPDDPFAEPDENDPEADDSFDGNEPEDGGDEFGDAGGTPTGDEERPRTTKPRQTPAGGGTQGTEDFPGEGGDDDTSGEDEGSESPSEPSGGSVEAHLAYLRTYAEMSGLDFGHAQVPNSRLTDSILNGVDKALKGTPRGRGEDGRMQPGSPGIKDVFKQHFQEHGQPDAPNLRTRLTDHVKDQFGGRKGPMPPESPEGPLEDEPDKPEPKHWWNEAPDKVDLAAFANKTAEMSGLDFGQPEEGSAPKDEETKQNGRTGPKMPKMPGMPELPGAAPAAGEAAGGAAAGAGEVAGLGELAELAPLLAL